MAEYPSDFQGDDIGYRHAALRPASAVIQRKILLSPEVSKNLWLKSSTMQYNVIRLFSVMAFLRIFVCAYSNFTENAFFL